MLQAKRRTVDASLLHLFYDKAQGTNAGHFRIYKSKIKRLRNYGYIMLGSPNESTDVT